ncbi:MAG: YbjN domain-containing protein [Actinomycetaceae bacterium]|nr:YbjN domain-containing protein [Actinomycetaceae bacterium]
MVSDNPQVPSPVTFERIKRAVESMGAPFEMNDEGDAGLADFTGFPFIFSFTTSGNFLSIRILWKSDLPMSMQTMSAMFFATDQWNREQYFSTIYTLVDDGLISVFADYICSVEAGMNDDQLLDNISAGVAAGIDGMNFMQSVARGLAAQLGE